MALQIITLVLMSGAMFFVGYFVGVVVRPTPQPTRAPEPISEPQPVTVAPLSDAAKPRSLTPEERLEEERRQQEADQRAFRTVLGYNADIAYGLVNVSPKDAGDLTEEG